MPLRCDRLVIGDGFIQNGLQRPSLKVLTSLLLVRLVAGMDVSEQPFALLRRQCSPLPMCTCLKAEEAASVGKRRAGGRRHNDAGEQSGEHAAHVAAAENICRAFSVRTSTPSRYASDSLSLCSTSMPARPRLTDS